MKEIDDFFNKIKATLPQSEEDWLELTKKTYNDLRTNKNNYSYWYPLVKDCGLPIVNSNIYILDFEMLDMIGDLYELRSNLATDEFYQTELYKKWQDKIKLMIKDLKSSVYNIKTGTFSNKFDFNTSICYKNDIPSKILELLFKDFEFEADGYSEFVIRDLIKSSNTKLTIYNGLPLNTEIRVFYDFDNRKVMYSHNYWDYDYCKNNLTPSDRLILENEKKELEYQYALKKERAENLVETHMSTVMLEGQWSIDLMYNEIEEKFYLIDMAIAQQSAYFKGII